MRFDDRICCFTLILAGAATARATECGELRLEQARLSAAATVENSLASTIADATKAKHQAAAKEASAQLKTVEKKLAAACAPRKATIAALPLGYLSTGPGNASRVSVEPGEKWGLSLTTLAGAGAGITFQDAAIVSAPAGARWEIDSKVAGEANGLALIVATDAQLTVEEPVAGRGAWRIELGKGAPLIVPYAKVKSCASASGATDVGGARLSGASCQMLLRAAPLDGKDAVPERGRAVLLGEWQYGDRVGFEIGDEIAEVAPPPGPAPRVDLVLELSAPIPGISDGKKLLVTAGANRKSGAQGAMVKLAAECGDDSACQDRWHDVEVWYDRAFAVPQVRVRPTGSGRVTGAILDRLGKLVAGQRVLAQVGDRKVITMADPDSKFRFDGLPAGEVTVTPIARSLSAKPQKALAHSVTLGVAGGIAPKLFIDRLFE
jgi:hypothetical protein